MVRQKPAKLLSPVRIWVPPFIQELCNLLFHSSLALHTILGVLMLYIVATPIGNLSDITYRAVETLKNCDYILCEDTRHSLSLLNHYNIKKPLKSFHQFCESSKQSVIINDLTLGNSICLISDAGTPGISDPGAQLIHACLEANIKVTSIPGPCAAITALCCSGLNTERFQFYGFLPRKAGELKRTFQEILIYMGTTICYESPNRLQETLACLREIAPNRKLVVARELTKKFEEIKRGTATELLQYWENTPLKGEIVLMISEDTTDVAKSWEKLTPIEHVEWMQTTYSLSRQEAICAVAKLRDVSKRDIYNIVHKEAE